MSPLLPPTRRTLNGRYFWNRNLFAYWDHYFPFPDGVAMQKTCFSSNRIHSKTRQKRTHHLYDKAFRCVWLLSCFVVWLLHCSFPPALLLRLTLWYKRLDLARGLHIALLLVVVVVFGPHCCHCRSLMMSW